MKKLNTPNIFILIILIITIKADAFPEMHYIVSGALNGTAAFASLESLQNNDKYIYFVFDFKFHNISVTNNNDIAYFLINSEINLENEIAKINYGFLDKIWTDINGVEDLNNVKWENIKLLHKEKIYSHLNYYYQVKRIDDKMNSLILRIPSNGKKEGSITIENILTLPDFEEKNYDM